MLFHFFVQVSLSIHEREHDPNYRPPEKTARGRPRALDPGKDYTYRIVRRRDSDEEEEEEYEDIKGGLVRPKRRYRKKKDLEKARTAFEGSSGGEQQPQATTVVKINRTSQEDEAAALSPVSPASPSPPPHVVHNEIPYVSEQSQNIVTSIRPVSSSNSLEHYVPVSVGGSVGGSSSAASILIPPALVVSAAPSSQGKQEEQQYVTVIPANSSSSSSSAIQHPQQLILQPHQIVGGEQTLAIAPHQHIATSTATGPQSQQVEMVAVSSSSLPQASYQQQQNGLMAVVPSQAVATSQAEPVYAVNHQGVHFQVVAEEPQQQEHQQ